MDDLTERIDVNTVPVKSRCPRAVCNFIEGWGIRPFHNMVDVAMEIRNMQKTWMALLILTVACGCQHVAEIQESRLSEIEMVSGIVREIESEHVDVPETISADTMGTKTYEAFVRASNLLLLLQDVCQQSQDMAVPHHMLKILPDSMRSLATDAIDADARAVIEQFATSIENNRADLDALALNSAVSLSTPNQNGVSFAAGLAVDAYFTHESITTRYEDAINAAFAVETKLEERFDVDFPSLTIAGTDEAAEMSDQDFADEAAAQFWKEAGRYNPPAD